MAAQAGARARFGAAEVVINSRGLRDVERPLDPPPGVERVLVLGDSFAEGFSVRLEDAVSRVLERELAAKGCPTEVVGGGTVGYSTDQQYLFYRDEGARYRPRVVVLLFYYNDVLYNARGAALAARPSRCSPSWAARRGSRTTRCRRLLPHGPNVRGAVRLRSPGRASGSARARPACTTPWPGCGFWSRVRPGEVPQEMQIFERAPPEPVVQAWLQTEHLLRLLDREARRHGARLLIAYVPSKMEVSRARLGAHAPALSSRRAQLRSRPRGGLLETGPAARVPVLDLTDALWREPGRARTSTRAATGTRWATRWRRARSRAFSARGGALCRVHIFPIPGPGIRRTMRAIRRSE